MRSIQLSTTEFHRLLEETGALNSGHFLLSSGRHSPHYIQCARLLQHPHHAEHVCSALAERFESDRVEVVVGPAMGGIIVAHEVGRRLRTRALFVERANGQFTLRRSFDVHPGERVLVVEDVVTTGGSILEVTDLLTHAGANIVGMGALVDRTGGDAVFGVRFEALLALTVPTFAQADCPQCAAGLAFDKPGSRGAMHAISAR